MLTSPPVKDEEMHRRIAQITAAAAVVAGLTVGAGAAQAYTVSTSGSPGTLGVPRSQGWVAANYSRVVSFPERFVYRSPAYAGNQVVRVYLRVWRYNRSYRNWDFQVQGIATDTLSAGEVMQTGRYSRAFTGLMEDTYATDVLVTWSRAADGVLIGRKIVDYVHSGDYTCYSTGCSVQFSPDAGQAGMFFG